MAADGNRNHGLHIIRGAWQRLAHNDVVTQYFLKSSYLSTPHAPAFRPDSERNRLEIESKFHSAPSPLTATLAIPYSELTQ